MKKSFLIIPAVLVFGIKVSFAQWLIQPLPAASGKSLSMDYFDKNHGIVCGGFIDFESHGRVSYTTNSGVIWYPGAVPETGKFFYSVKFVNAGKAYMGGAYQPADKYRFSSGNTSGSEWKAYFLKSENYGKDWMEIHSNGLESYNNLEALDFISENQGIAIANNFTTIETNTDNIIKTIDSGNNWSILFSITNSVKVDLICIKYVSKDFICAAGNHSGKDFYRGYFYRTDNGGNIWDTITIENLTINNFCFTDRYTGYLLGTGSDNNLSMLFKTSDGGFHWELIQTFTDNYYNGVTFLKESGRGLLFGFRRFFENPALSITADFGNSWRNQSIPPTTDLLFSDAVILSQDEMNVTGGEIFSGGLVLHTTNGGLTYINNSYESNDKKNYYLFQNYPNPFNPVTEIRYELKINSFVTLEIFNAAGNEIETLVNEKQEKGSHEIRFNGSSLASGIYYYRIKTNSYTEAKKMMLIR